METTKKDRPSELYLLRGDDHEGFRKKIQRAVKAMQWRMEQEEKRYRAAVACSTLDYRQAGTNDSFLTLQTLFNGVDED